MHLPASITHHPYKTFSHSTQLRLSSHSRQHPSIPAAPLHLMRRTPTLFGAPPFGLQTSGGKKKVVRIRDPGLKRMFDGVIRWKDMFFIANDQMIKI